MSRKEDIKQYLSKIGRKGGKKSRRKLTPEQAREMVRIRTIKLRKKKKLKLITA